MSSWQEIWRVEVLGNSLGAWAVSFGVFLVTFAVPALLSRLIRAQNARRARRTGAAPLPMLELALELSNRTGRLFLWGMAIWLASRDLSFPPRLERVLTVALVLVFWLQMASWAMTAVRFGIDAKRRRMGGHDTMLASSMSVIMFVAGLLIWGIASLLALENLGVAIGPLLAGVGIGGIAIALAVQTVLADLLASLAIALDKPFTLGDSLKIDDVVGTVEYIGVKSTRLRSVNGEQIIISNADLLKSRLRNFGRLFERRSLFTLGVHYETPVEKLAAIPHLVREIIEATPDTRFERCNLLNYGATALEFETVFFVTKADYKVYVDAQQSINLRIIERLRGLGVAFAAEAPTNIRLQAPPQVAQAAQKSLLG
jgi:small-conductance mechanosensitive channel